jgi:hypothetical protein
MVERKFVYKWCEHASPPPPSFILPRLCLTRKTVVPTEVMLLLATFCLVNGRVGRRGGVVIERGEKGGCEGVRVLNFSRWFTQ